MAGLGSTVGRTLEERAAAVKEDAAADKEGEKREAARRRQQRAQRRNKGRARREKKRAKDRKERGVYSEVTRVDAEGNRHCVRCDSSELETERVDHALLKTVAGGVFGGAGTAWAGPLAPVLAPFVGGGLAYKAWRDSTYKVCQQCGAAYPIE